MATVTRVHVSEGKGDDDLSVFDDLVEHRESPVPPRPLVRHSLAPPSVPISPTSPELPARRSSAPSLERLTRRSSSVPPMPVTPPFPAPPRDVRTLPGIGAADIAPLSTLPPAAMGDVPLAQQPSLEGEIEARRRTRAKKIAAVGALVGMFLAGYCTRGRVSADRTSASKQETASVRAVDDKAVSAAPRQVTAPAPGEHAIVVTELSKEADHLPVAEDRAADVAAAEKKRGRAAKATLVAAKPSAIAFDAPAGDPVAAVPPAEEAQAGSGGSCTLNINSIPISRVAVDGRPMGLTPALGVSVPAGTHNVLLVTDTLRKTTSATCKAGEKKTISLRLTLGGA